MIDPELQWAKPQRKPARTQKQRAEIKIWVSQPKIDLLEAAIGELVEREPWQAKVAMLIAKEARLERLQKVLYSLAETRAKRQEEMFPCKICGAPAGVKCSCDY